VHCPVDVLIVENDNKEYSLKFQVMRSLLADAGNNQAIE